MTYHSVTSYNLLLDNVDMNLNFPAYDFFIILTILKVNELNNDHILTSDGK